MATHSSILAWRIPWTEEPGGLRSTGLQRVGHDRATSLMDVQLIQHHLFKRLFLLHSIDFAHLSKKKKQKTTQYICVDLFLGSCSVPSLHCLPLYHCYVVLIIVVTQYVLILRKMIPPTLFFLKIILAVLSLAI